MVFIWNIYRNRYYKTNCYSITIIIRDDKGNEEILPVPVRGKRGGIWDIILASIFLFSFLVLPWLFLALEFYKALLFWILSLSIPALLVCFVFFAWDNKAQGTI